MYISKRNSEVVSGSVNIQNDLIYFSLPSNDTFFLNWSRLTGEPLLAWFPDIQGFLKYEYNLRTK